jgi:hypothetical protein
MVGALPAKGYEFHTHGENWQHKLNVKFMIVGISQMTAAPLSNNICKN